MGNSLYWSVYKNLEKEVLDLSQWVFIDDGQLATYSVKTADLLMRTSVEIESISKALYFRYGGTKPDDNNLFFDSDCLKLLQEKFTIGSKVVFVSDVFQYCSKEENLTLHPLNNSWVRGKCDWKKAYQAIKHDRYSELKKAILSIYCELLQHSLCSICITLKGCTVWVMTQKPQVWIREWGQTFFQ